MTWKTDPAFSKAEGKLGFTVYDVDNKILYQRAPTWAEKGATGSIKLSSTAESITFLTKSDNGFRGVFKMMVADEEILYRCIDCLPDSPSTTLSRIYLDGNMDGVLDRPGFANCKKTCTFKRFVPLKYTIKIQLCSDQGTDSKIKSGANGKIGDHFIVKLDDDVERIVHLPLHKVTNSVLETELIGDLAAASTIAIRYVGDNIICIEKFTMETFDGKTKFEIIQVTLIIYHLRCLTIMF